MSSSCANRQIRHLLWMKLCMCCKVLAKRTSSLKVKPILFTEINYNYLSLRADSIFITPEGLLRFSPIRIEDNISNLEGCDCSIDPIPVYFQKT